MWTDVATAVHNDLSYSGGRLYHSASQMPQCNKIVISVEYFCTKFFSRLSMRFSKGKPA